MRIYQNSGNDEHENDNENNDDMIGKNTQLQWEQEREKTITIIKTRLYIPRIIFVTV